MNKFLADCVGVLNGLVAVVIIGACTIADLIADRSTVGGGYFIVGILVGLVVATLVCGVLALLVDIRNELVRIRKGDARAVTGSTGYQPNSLAAMIRGK